VDPLEEADEEAEEGEEDGAGEVEDGDIELAVHAVVEGREHAAGDEEVDACVVEAVGDGVDSFVSTQLLLDMG